MRQLEFAAGFQRGDSADQKLDKLESVLVGATDNVAEAVPLLAALLSIPYAHRYPVLETIMSDLVRKQRTMHVIEEQLALLSERGPLLIVFEDVHWADPTSVEMLGRILRRVTGLRAMVVANFRPEFVPPWLELGHVTLLTLNQLGRRQVDELIEKVAAGMSVTGTGRRSDRRQGARRASVRRGDDPVGSSRRARSMGEDDHSRSEARRMRPSSSRRRSRTASSLGSIGSAR